MELAFDLWLFGAPVLAIVWALLHVAHRAAGRMRYLIAVAGFAAAAALPFAVFLSPQPAASTSAPVTIDVRPAAHPLKSVWELGALVLLAGVARDHARMRRRRNAVYPAPDAFREALSWPRHSRLAIGEGCTPATIGMIRPVVVMPANLLEIVPHPVARRIAQHELSHCRWRDPLVFGLLRVIASVLWIAPLWIALAWVRREREVAADEAGWSDPVSYAEALLALARSKSRRNAFVLQMAGSDLEFRARRILSIPSRRFTVAAVAVTIAAAGALVEAAPVHLGLDAVRIIRQPQVSAPVLVTATPTPEVRQKPKRTAAAREPLPLGTKSAPIDMLRPAADEAAATSPAMEAHIGEHVDTHVDEHADEHVHAHGADDGDRVVIRAHPPDQRSVIRHRLVIPHNHNH